jgi:hypothetical protein
MKLKLMLKHSVKFLHVYAMFALAKNDWVPCISCGYPMLRGFAPEKHHRFDRMVTCSLGCFYNHAHYKDTDQDVLKNRTVKEVTDTLQAACVDMIKAVRHANGEEVAGGISFNLAEALRNNQKHLSDSLMTMQRYLWNSAAVVGPKCNSITHTCSYGAGDTSIDAKCENN